jgi:hypothetical protein
MGRIRIDLRVGVGWIWVLDRDMKAIGVLGLEI